MSSGEWDILGVQAVGGYVGESAALEVGVPGVVLLRVVGDVSEVGLDSRVLEPGAREVVGEATGRGVPRDFGADGGGAPNCCDEGAGGREDRVELGSNAVGSLAGRADTYRLL